MKKRKYTYDVRYVVIFVMLDTSQIVTTFNPLWSHIVANNCDIAAYILHSYYEIVLQLLLICISTKTSVNFSPHITEHRQSVDILYDCYYGHKICLVCRSDNSGVF